MTTTQNPQEIPALPPPEGMHSDFDSPISMYTTILGLGITCIIILVISVGIRTYTKAVILKDLKHEDGTYLHFYISDSANNDTNAKLWLYYPR